MYFQPCVSLRVQLGHMVLWCFHLCGSTEERGVGEFPWRHLVLPPLTGGREPCDVLCPLVGTGRVGTESGDQVRCTLALSRTAPRRESGGGFGP